MSMGDPFQTYVQSSFFNMLSGSLTVVYLRSMQRQTTTKLKTRVDLPPITLLEIALLLHFRIALMADPGGRYD